MENYKLSKNHVLALKILYPNRQSAHNAFQYPEVGGTVVAPDWKNTRDCGHGLHGYLWGQGSLGISLFNLGASHVFQVHQVNRKDFIVLNKKIKYRKAKVVFETDCPFEATQFIEKHINVSTRIEPIFRIVKNKKKLKYSTNILASGVEGSIMSGGPNCHFFGENNMHQMTGRHSLVVAKDNAVQSTSWSSILIAGNNARQSSSETCIHQAGKYSTIHTDNSSKVKAGFGSVITFSLGIMSGVKKIQIDNKKYHEDKWYSMKNGKVIEVDSPEINLEKIYAKKELIEQA